MKHYTLKQYAEKLGMSRQLLAYNIKEKKIVVKTKVIAGVKFIVAK